MWPEDRVCPGLSGIEGGRAEGAEGMAVARVGTLRRKGKLCLRQRRGALRCGLQNGHFHSHRPAGDGDVAGLEAGIRGGPSHCTWSPRVMAAAHGWRGGTTGLDTCQRRRSGAWRL